LVVTTLARRVFLLAMTTAITESVDRYSVWRDCVMKEMPDKQIWK
jgi:hypothetical protein